MFRTRTGLSETHTTPSCDQIMAQLNGCACSTAAHAKSKLQDNDAHTRSYSKANSVSSLALPCHLVVDQRAGKTLHLCLLLLHSVLSIQQLCSVCGTAAEGRSVTCCLALPLFKPVAPAGLAGDIVGRQVCLVGASVPAHSHKHAGSSSDWGQHKVQQECTSAGMALAVEHLPAGWRFLQVMNDVLAEGHMLKGSSTVASN